MKFWPFTKKHPPKEVEERQINAEFARADMDFMHLQLERALDGLLKRKEGKPQ